MNKFPNEQVSRLEVTVDDAVAVRVHQRLADLVRDTDRVLERQPMALGLLEQIFERATGHELAYHKEAAIVLADVIDIDDVGMLAELAHRTRLAPHPGPAVVVKSIGLDQRKRHIALQASVMRQIDDLAAALAEQAFDLVSPPGECGRRGWLRACQVGLPYARGSLSVDLEDRRAPCLRFISADSKTVLTSSEEPDGLRHSRRATLFALLGQRDRLAVATCKRGGNR
jgi:hypothetical protein